MNYVYTPVKNENSGKCNKLLWKHVLKQIFICMGPWSVYFGCGMIFGTPTVMIPQLRKEANSTEVVTETMESWLSSIVVFCALPWTIILPVLSHMYGRKLPAIITFIVGIIGFTIWYCSKNVMTILIGEIFLGVMVACNFTHSIVVIPEYSSPRYRGMFLTIKSATFFWGIFVANLIGTFSHWRNIVLLAIVCLMYNITIFFWPQSPYWLASQGRFEECAVSHRTLKGTSDEAEQELEQLINSQKTNLEKNPQQTAVLSYERLRNFFEVFTYKVVYKPLLLSAVLLTGYSLSGKVVCNVYAIQILKKITVHESTAYNWMLILDSVSLLSMYFGCYLAKILKRRVMLFTASFISISMLLTLSLYLYLIKLNYVTDNSVVSITLLTLFSLSISCGPMLLNTSLYAELMPLRYKSATIILLIFINNIVTAIVVKVTPFVFKAVGLHGGFLCFGLGYLICLLILYKYLPETKDKTLSEIEDYFK